MKTEAALSPDAPMMLALARGYALRTFEDEKMAEYARQPKLRAFDVKLQRAEKDRGGMLSHIAEFLISQRGVTR